MNNASEYAAYYLEQLRQGSSEDAFFALIEAGAVVLPALIEACARQENRGIRTQIVRCIWHHRRAETIGFLAGLLDDHEQAVWQEALDGVVAIGGSEAIEALQEARARFSGDRTDGAVRVEWIDEALEQIRDQGAENLGRR